MRIAINGKSLGVPESGGALRVATQLIRHIAMERVDADVHVYVPVVSSAWKPSWDYPSNVRFHLSCSYIFGSGWGKLLWEQFVFPIRARNQACEVVLNLTNTAPVLLSPKIPQILLVHDVGFLNREWFSRSFSWYLRLVIGTAVRRGVHVATVSQSSADEIVRKFPVQKVKVIPNGLEKAPCDITPANLGFPYILFLGSLNPRKNISGAIAAFHSLRRCDVRLVIVGAEKNLFAQSRQSLSLSGVEFMGYVSDQKKWSLLKGAELLLLPSFLEGFGLPILEALHVGTPVVASNIPVFRELFGDIIEYVDPHVPQEIAKGIHTVLSDTNRRVRMNKRRSEILNRFTWNHASRQYLQWMEDLIISK